MSSLFDWQPSARLPRGKIRFFFLFLNSLCTLLIKCQKFKKWNLSFVQKLLMIFFTSILWWFSSSKPNKSMKNFTFNTHSLIATFYFISLCLLDCNFEKRARSKNISSIFKWASWKRFQFMTNSRSRLTMNMKWVN